ncbi:MAG TPA: ferritin-like domain-containing protein [Burkholderiaceae bacterium]|nr:ferritin-like domain-containing protein [Burkholderiaceae bacterium]
MSTSETPAFNAPSSSAAPGFVKDIAAIRERARSTMRDGAVTPNYGLDTDTVVRLLNDALATEIVCTLRYRRHYFCAEGIHSEAVKAEFLEHANQELAHADRIAERIVQLGGSPDLRPDTLAGRSHAEYVEGTTLREMIEENLVAERIAIETYREMIQFLSDRDPTTRRMLEEVLADEEEHADDMGSLLKQVPGN